MVRYIDISVALNELEHTPFYDKRDYETAKEMLKSIPTSDAVEVVRCKDCKHKYCDGNQIICQKLYWCDGSNFEPAAGDFCSHGERRE